MRNAVPVLLLSAFTVTSAFAQAGAAGSTTGGSTGAGGAPSTGAGAGASAPGRSIGPAVPQTPTTNQNQTAPNIQRTIFISGKVMMDDGSPIPSNIVIQRLCNGNARSVAYADSKGHFSFQWGQQSSFMADASEAGFSSRNSSGGGFGSAQSAGGGNPLSNDPFGSQMSGCEIRAQLAGYRSDSVNLVSRNPMDNPDIGMIVLHRLGNVEGTSISATSFMAPKDAKKAYEKGLQSLLKNKPDDASKEFEKAVLAYPKYADAWTNLGKARMQQKSFEPAREALLKAIEADPKLVSPYIELGMLAAQENKWAEAGPYLDRALKLDPIDFPQAWYVDAAANFNLKKFDAAEKSAREAQKLDGKHVNPRTDYLLGLILAEKHDFPGAAEQFRAYLKNSPDAPDYAKVKDQLGQVEKYLDQTKEAAKQ
jgi:tetratricopeptide (TPR) repeat protein